MSRFQVVLRHYSFIAGAIALSLLLLAGCDRSRSSGGGSSSSSSSSSSSTSSSSSSGSAAPTAAIAFPPPNSLTDAETIIVRGTASDTDTITQVLVNGIAASTSNGYATWSVEIDLEPGENVLTVETSDSLSNTDASAATAVINRQEPAIFHPKSVVLDAANNRILALDDEYVALVAVDLATGVRTVISDFDTGAGPEFDSPASLALDNNRVLVADSGLGALLAVDLSSGDRAIIADADTGDGPDLIEPEAVILGPVANTALVADIVLDALLLVNLTDGERTVISDGSTGGGQIFLNVRSIALDIPNDRVLAVDDSLLALLAVDLTTGVRTVISDNSGSFGAGEDFSSPQSVVLDATNNRALVMDQLGFLVAVNLTTGPELGNRTTISDNSGTKGTGEFFIAPVSVALDSVNNRALVGDIGANALLTVNLGTGPELGDRTVISASQVGAGDRFITPISMVFDAANNRAFVVNQEFLPALVEVDLATGDRTVISGDDRGIGHDFDSPSGLVLDTANNRALVADSGLGALLEVDLITGDRTVISDNSGTNGIGPDFQGPGSFVLDSANNRVLLTDIDFGVYAALVAVDLSTGDRTVISGDGVGAGPDFTAVTGIALDSVNNRALVTDFGSGLLAVNLTAGPNLGERTVISDDSSGGAPIAALAAVALDAANNRALVVDFFFAAIMEVDLASGEREVISDFDTGTGPCLCLVISIAPDLVNDRVFVADIESSDLVAIDLLNGQRVIWSR